MLRAKWQTFDKIPDTECWRLRGTSYLGAHMTEYRPEWAVIVMPFAEKPSGVAGAAGPKRQKTETDGPDVTMK